MHCPSCGSAVAQNLSYCNRCGARVNGVTKQAELFPASLVNAMAAVFVVGLGAIIGLMAVMKKVVGFDLNIILAVTVFSLALMLVVEGVLIRLLLNGKRGAKWAGDTERQKGHTTRDIGDVQARLLPEPVPSVTEHTTRSFDPIYSERENDAGRG